MFDAVFMCFSPYLRVRWGGWGGGGSPKGMLHNLLVQFFTLGISKVKALETSFFVVLTTYTYHPRYVKHV